MFQSISSGCHNRIQMTLEQHGFELRGSTYARIFFFSRNTYYSTHDPQLIESADAE